MRNKKGQFVKGMVPWNKGKKGVMPIPWNKGTKGLVPTPSNAFKKGHTPWCAGKKGVMPIPWNKGKGHLYSKELRDKFSKAFTGRKWSKKARESHEKNKSRFWLGKKFSTEHKRKLKEARSRQVTPLINSSIERKVQRFLKKLKVEFKSQKYIGDITEKYNCDIFIPLNNIVIECDGDYWHNYPVGKPIDHIRTKQMLEKGYQVLRLWESQIKEMQIGDFQEILVEKGINLDSSIMGGNK